MSKTRLTKMEDGNFAWGEFLKKISREMLKDASVREMLPADAIAAGWLGFEGATENEISAVENRIGLHLPNSYRSFLAETNGWRNCGPFIFNIYQCEDVVWFREQNQEWIDAYLGTADELEIGDKDYFSYDDTQDSSRFRRIHLQSTLAISGIGDSAILLLNPEVINDSGEWEAWFFADWLPGAHRYRSFVDLMRGEFEAFQQLRKDVRAAPQKLGNAGQQAARRGETSKAVVMLRKRASEGDESSAASLAELCAFLGLWDEVIANMGKLIRNISQIRNLGNYPMQLFQLLARAGHETGRWTDILKITEMGIAAELKRHYDQHHEAIRTAYLTWFRNLKRYCKKRKEPISELTRVFDIANPIDKLSDEERRREYEKAVQNKHAQHLKKKPTEYARHRLALARSFKLEDEIIAIYERLPSAIHFNDALDVCRSYMRRGDRLAAWAVLRDRIHQSAGDLPQHVAPIILLVDDLLRPLMTRERCDLILSTPRGPEATKM